MSCPHVISCLTETYFLYHIQPSHGWSDLLTLSLPVQFSCVCNGVWLWMLFFPRVTNWLNDRLRWWGRPDGKEPCPHCWKTIREIWHLFCANLLAFGKVYIWFILKKLETLISTIKAINCSFSSVSQSWLFAECCIALGGPIRLQHLHNILSVCVCERELKRYVSHLQGPKCSSEKNATLHYSAVKHLYTVTMETGGSLMWSRQ